MDSMHIFLHIAFLIVLAKLSSYFMVKLKLPSVLGMLLVGIIIGPSLLDIIEVDRSVKVMGEIGVLLLLFQAGIDTDLSTVRKNGWSPFFIALGGVTLPFIGGFYLSRFFSMSIENAVIIGMILTATSVSVTVKTLIDLKKVRSIEGTLIIESAIIDDVIGIVLLTFVFAFIFKENNPLYSFVKIFVFILEMLIMFVVIKPILHWANRTKVREMELSFAIAFMLVAAYLARLGGLADITGAFFAGLFVSLTPSKKIVEDGMEKIGESLFIPIFFLMIGIETNIRSRGIDIPFTLWFILIAVFTKVIGSYMGSIISGFNSMVSLRVATGMIPRGEVALVISNIGLAHLLIDSSHFASVVIMVIVSSIITPFLLKLLFKERSQYEGV